MRGDHTAKFTADEILNSGYCVHSVRTADCPGCIRGMIRYQGRIEGILEVMELLKTNGAIADCMQHVLKDYEHPGTHFHEGNVYDKYE